MMGRLAFGRKVLVAPAVGFVLLLVLLAVTYSLSKRNEAQLERIHTEYRPALALTRDLQDRLRELQRTLQESVASEDESQLADADRLCIRFISRVAEGEQIPGNDRENLQALSSAASSYCKLAATTTRRLMHKMPGDDLTPSLQAMTSAYRVVHELLDQDLERAQRGVDEAIAASPALQRSALRWSTALIVASVLLMGFISLAFAHSLSRRVERLRTASSRMGAGDLDARVVDGGSDELGQLADSFNQMAHSLREMLVARSAAEESERELRAMAEFREMFIGILGHDLRNPLAAIKMAAGLLQRSEQFGEQDKQAVALISNSARRMTRMINQLLDLTRARLGGGLPLELKPTDLREVCRSIVEEFEAAIRLEVEGDVTGIWDPDRLAEVVSNIAGNAIEHATPGTVVVVKARANGEQGIVEISNQGTAIPPDVLPFIFEPFRRGRQRQKSATGNLGLGLYIARQIVLSHGGTLEASSAFGTTTFVMRLPCRPPANRS